MATGGATTRSAAFQDPGARLREARMASSRSRIGRPARIPKPATLRTQSAPPLRRADEAAPQRDRAAELRANRHISQRFTNPRASMPELQTLANDIGDDGDEEDIAAAADLEESMNDIAQEAEETEDLAMLARVRAQQKEKAKKGMQSARNKETKRLEKMAKNLQTEGAAKFGSAADPVIDFETTDTVGTAVSVAHVGVSVFEDSFSEPQKEMLTKIGLPILDPKEIVDLAIVSGTGMQVLKWSVIVTVFGPFCVVFIFMSILSACFNNLACKTGANVLSVISSFLQL